MIKRLLFMAATMCFLISCNNGRSTRQSNSDGGSTANQLNIMKQKEERNKQIALDCINAWDSGDMERIIKHLSPDAVDYGDSSTPPAQGIDAFRSFMELWRFSVNSYQSDNELAVAEGDYVFIYADWSGSFKNDFMGLRTAGKSFAFKDVDIFKFDEEGKITEHRAVLFSTLLKQIASDP